MADAEEKGANLRSIGVFDGLAEADIDALATLAEEMQMAPGVVLCEQGREADCCWILLEGDADVVVDGAVVSAIGPGEVIGEMALIERRPRTATVVAKTPVRAYRISAFGFELLLSSPATVEALKALSAKRLRERGKPPSA